MQKNLTGEFLSLPDCSAYARVLNACGAESITLPTIISVNLAPAESTFYFSQRQRHGEVCWCKTDLIMAFCFAGEDDGYLALYLYDAATNGSEFVVYDARSFSEKPVARVRLPQRVPQVLLAFLVCCLLRS